MSGTPSSPKNELLKSISDSFGSYDNFKAEFKKNALSVFGSGYAWLVYDKHTNRKNQLRIMTTANQDTTLPCTICPIFLIDVWEHAYYLKYHNVRAEYID